MQSIADVLNLMFKTIYLLCKKWFCLILISEIKNEHRSKSALWKSNYSYFSERKAKVCMSFETLQKQKLIKKRKMQFFFLKISLEKKNIHLAKIKLIKFKQWVLNILQFFLQNSKKKNINSKALIFTFKVLLIFLE